MLDHSSGARSKVPENRSKWHAMFVSSRHSFRLTFMTSGMEAMAYFRWFMRFLIRIEKSEDISGEFLSMLQKLFFIPLQNPIYKQSVPV